jgi:hypothetical protein
MPAISENFADLLEPGLRKIFTDQYNQIPEMYQSLFNVNTTEKPYEKDSSVGAFGDMEPFNGQITYDEVYQGYDVKYEFAEFAKGFKIERKLFDKLYCRIKIWLNRWNSLVDNTEERLVTC